MTDRPKEIAWFERLFLVVIAIGVAGMAADQEALRSEPSEVAVTTGVSLVVTLALVLAVSRLRSNAARWVLTVLVIVSLPFSLPQFDAGAVPAVAGFAILALQLGSLYFLFTPPARAWLAKGETETVPEPNSREP